MNEVKLANKSQEEGLNCHLLQSLEFIGLH